MKYSLAILGFATLAACEPSGHMPVGDCGIQDYQGIIGSNLAAVSMPAELRTRVIRPGQAVTADFYADRMNIIVDTNGVIENLTCG